MPIILALIIQVFIGVLLIVFVILAPAVHNKAVAIATLHVGVFAYVTGEQSWVFLGQGMTVGWRIKN